MIAICALQEPQKDNVRMQRAYFASKKGTCHVAIIDVAKGAAGNTEKALCD